MQINFQCVMLIIASIHLDPGIVIFWREQRKAFGIMVSPMLECYHVVSDKSALIEVYAANTNVACFLTSFLCLVLVETYGYSVGVQNLRIFIWVEIVLLLVWFFLGGVVVSSLGDWQICWSLGCNRVEVHSCIFSNPLYSCLLST